MFELHARSAFSFLSSGSLPEDLIVGAANLGINGVALLDRDNVCIRAGHHCAMPLHQKLGVPATSRVGFWVYNTLEDIDILVRGIEKATNMLRISTNL